MREKFNRTIDSSAFKSSIERHSAINVLKMDDANKLLGHFVKKSKAFQRDDVPIDKLKSYVTE